MCSSKHSDRNVGVADHLRGFGPKRASSPGWAVREGHQAGLSALAGAALPKRPGQIAWLTRDFPAFNRSMLQNYIASRQYSRMRRGNYVSDPHRRQQSRPRSPLRHWMHSP